ncbi:MAG: hypothetical protein ABJA83_14260 [Burkholderiaceae bacterium]
MKRVVGCEKLLVAVACGTFAGSAVAELLEVKLTPGDVVEKRLTVPPGKFGEICSALNRGQAVSWQFRSDAVADFNVHYHVDKRVEYPEQRKNVKDGAGRLVIQSDQDYCWMWTNRSSAPIALDVTLKETGR